ncbi:mucin-13 [Triplophysa rosa]|uniref:mucin-13 n=1 Tax=Triplophysa rosa TaxID=992332 RepID=UPI00254634D1|nr:mucin-13 [Triplophysa rosa]
MDRILRPHATYAAAYLDDIIIHSNDWQRHIEHLRAVLRSLREAGLTANPKKCAIGRVEVNTTSSPTDGSSQPAHTTTSVPPGGSSQPTHTTTSVPPGGSSQPTHTTTSVPPGGSSQPAYTTTSGPTATPVEDFYMDSSESDIEEVTLASPLVVR